MWAGKVLGDSLDSEQDIILKGSSTNIGDFAGNTLVYAADEGGSQVHGVPAAATVPKFVPQEEHTGGVTMAETCSARKNNRTNSGEELDISDCDCVIVDGSGWSPNPRRKLADHSPAPAFKRSRIQVSVEEKELTNNTYEDDGDVNPASSSSSSAIRTNKFHKNSGGSVDLDGRKLSANGSKKQIQSTKKESAASKTRNSSSLQYDLPTIDAPAAHQACKSWVIFSDLHVKSASMDVCEQVLDRVHQAAVKRNAGVIFLGDFWHVRGSLSVELLNKVLKVLCKWTQPVIMIPGNHDQVTLGGKVHSLEPLRYAFQPDKILMIDEPAVCLGALWVPYRRDSNVMRAVLQRGADTPGVSMIFCHADVRGAYMNDNMRSKEGLDIEAFPKNIPIYSGHFHKPQDVTKGGSTLRYVGSPYQTSLAEAGQEKFFYCVQRGHDDLSPARSTETWHEVVRWAVNIGGKYFKASSPSDSIIGNAVAGDRLVVTVPVGHEHAAEKLRELRAKDIDVTLNYELNPLTRQRNASRTDALSSESDTAAILVDNMGPQSVFDSYMKQLASDPTVAAALAKKASADDSVQLSEVLKNTTEKEKLHINVREQGHHIIAKLASTSLRDGSALGDHAVAGGGNGARVKELRLDKVSLRNFGPYGGDTAVEYPLSSRGLVLIRGQSTDGTGANSNGAGKTTLAMSVLWGLTGSLDPRVVKDNNVANVVYDSSSGNSSASTTNNRTAEVIVTGTINNLSFKIIRRRRAKKAELHFSVDGTVLTTQAVKDTQALIDEHLGIKDGLLQRCCFFGQHTHTMQSLLGLTDVKLKLELSALVDTSLWVEASKEARSEAKGNKARLETLAGNLSLRKQDLSAADKASREADRVLAGIQASLETAQKSLAEVPAVDSSIPSLTEELTVLQKTQELLVKDTIEPLKIVIAAAVQRRATETASLDKAINQLRLDVTKSRTEKKSTLDVIAGLQKKRNLLATEEEALTKKINTFQAKITSALSSLTGVTVDAADLPAVRQLYEQAQAELTTVSNRIDTANTSLIRLNEINRHACSSTNKVGAPLAESMADEACPTCGQEMPQESRANRTRDLNATLAALKVEKEGLSERTSGLRKLLDNSTHLLTTADQKNALQERIKEMQAEIALHSDTLTAQSAHLVELERVLKLRELEKAAFVDEFGHQEGAHLKEQTAANTQLATLQAQEAALRKKIDSLREQQVQRSRLLSEVSIAEVHVSSARACALDRSTARDGIQAQIDQMTEKSKTFTSQMVVFERLASVLGTRGVQNFVFQNVIKHLESITTDYLVVLAEGGIQLALQGDGEDENHIVKSVLVRSKESGGECRERTLAQLSGGQWRRVSLALDLAFTELIRRRGVLRCNLMVMDEVLTHLDASGRESVGTVLRAMVQGPGAFSSKATESESADTAAGVDEFGVALPSTEERRMQQQIEKLVGGGAYETVIVILQDLAAEELSEAFDHVDVVVKESDCSRVEIEEAQN